MKQLIYISTIIVLIFYSCASENNSRDNSKKSSEKSSETEKLSGDTITVRIAWDTSYFERIYRLSDSLFTFCLRKTATNKESCLFVAKIDNSAVFNKISNDSIETEYLSEKSYYSNGLQAIELNLKNKKKKIAVQDFGVEPINIIAEQINNQLPNKLKDYLIRK